MLLPITTALLESGGENDRWNYFMTSLCESNVADNESKLADMQSDALVA